MAKTLSEVTRLLLAWNEGDTEAREQLIPLVYDELHAIAARQLGREGEKRDHTLQPTALVNELYLRLVDQKRVHWKEQQEFFGVAAELIRRILVDHARKRQTIKRGGEVFKIPLDETLGIAAARDPGLLALDDALRDLAKHDPRGSRIVELHVFGGLQFDEIAEILGISRSTALRDWKHAKLWLKRELQRE